MMCGLLSILLIAFNIIRYVLTSDVLGCGGFVKSNVNINYSVINVKLLTAKSIVKYSTDCAPNNGYYFIPVYDMGEYILKISPPDGWTFQPSTISLNIDGETDPCSLQHDIDFVFKGFTVKGKVFSDGSVSGPSGVSVKLRAKLTDNILKTTLTSDDGFYEFKEVLPGDYVIQASHHSWKFRNSEVSVSVTNDNVDISLEEQNISILGFEVIGNVMSDGEPIKDVLFALYSTDSVKSVLGCDSKQIPNMKKLDDNSIYLCHVSSDKNGLFRFQTVPNGNYILVPFYRGKNIHFDVKPASLNFQVFNENLKLSTVFQIEGFSVSGVVSIGGDNSIKAEITLIDVNTGIEQTIVTKTNGVYHLENVKTGNYKIIAKSDHIYFAPLSVKISPTASQLPVISPIAFDVCGHIIFKISDIEPITVNIASDKITESTLSDNNGNFCFSVSSGKYIVKVISELHSSIQFTPSEFSVTVENTPILDIVFTQFTASLSGSIKYIDKANDLQLQLINKRSNELTVLKYNQMLKSSNKFELNFKFENLLPDSYSITIIKESNSWCWEKDSYDVVIVNKNISDVRFIQKGYLLSMYFSHTVELKLKYPSNKIEMLKVNDNHTVRHCVIESGIYSIIPLGCHKFSDNDQESITFDTSKDSGKLISRTAVKHLLSANIVTNLNVSDIVLTVKQKSFSREESTEKLHLQNYKVIQDQNTLLYEYPISIWVKPMVNIYLEPSSSHLLFKPTTYETKLEDNCLKYLLTFNGRTGLFVNGEITPKLEDVAIKIMSGEHLIFNVKSDKLGKYSAGPFDSDADLNIFAEKEGYVFKPIPNKLGNFQAIKLSQIFVQIIDNSEQPLSGVLISISGGKDNYRKNSITPTSGQLSFNNLHTGQYFIRIMMKEYEFDPSSKMIDIEEGSKIEIKVRAEKVAFSCFGLTDSLNGDPEANVAVEAIGLRNVILNSKINCSQLQEEVLSDPNGSFRIKGLRPECHYAVRIKSSDENRHIHRTIPANHLIRVSDNDITGIRLIIIRKMTHMDVSGDVITSQEFLPTLKVRLFSELNPDQPITALTLDSSPFFFFPPLPIDNRNYFIRLESSLSNNFYDYETPIMSLRSNTSHTHFTFYFNPQLRSNANAANFNEQELISNSSIYTLPFLIIIITIVYNYQKIAPFLVQIVNYLNKVSIFNFNVRKFTNSDVDNPLGIKRKIKSKKI